MSALAMRRSWLIGAMILAIAGSALADEFATPQAVFDSMRAAFRVDKAAGVRARYQFELSGPQGGEWWIEVREAKAKFGRGQIASPDVTFIASDKDWVALSSGRLSGAWATLTGRLKIRGSHALARKLDEMFP